MSSNVPQRFAGLATAAALVVVVVSPALASEGVGARYEEAERQLRHGDVIGARKLLAEVLTEEPENGPLAYRVAALFAAAGLDSDAMTALAEAFDRGYAEFERPLRHDPAFESMRREPAFQRLVFSAARSRRRMLLKAATSDPALEGRHLVEAAQLYALAGDLDRGIEMLAEGLARGYRGFSELEQGLSFAVLRADPRFRDVVGAAMRSAYAWTGTDQQKISGLMAVHAEVRFNFAFFDQVPEIDWDAEVAAVVPRVLGVRSIEAYYEILAELVAKLRDGHTSITYPRSMTAFSDHVPVAIEPIGGRFVVTRVAAIPELEEAGVLRGDALVSIDDVAVDEQYLDDRILRFQSYSTRHAALAYGAKSLLVGTAGKTVEVVFERPDGEEYGATLTFDSQLADGTRFDRGDDSPVKVEEVAPGIFHVELRTFDSSETSDAFTRFVNSLVPRATRGIILDIRSNAGGDSPVGWEVISRLIDSQLATASWRTSLYRPAFRAWGRGPEWYEGTAPVIRPASGARFHGPVVVLTSALTYSAAEDFCVPLRHGRRAVFVGQTTGGSTGQALKVFLPGGGSLRVCAKRDAFPDGTEFVGTGIPPDIEVRPTVADIVRGHDPVLTTAVAVVEEAASGAEGASIRRLQPERF